MSVVAVVTGSRGLVSLFVAFVALHRSCAISDAAVYRSRRSCYDTIRRCCRTHNAHSKNTRVEEENRDKKKKKKDYKAHGKKIKNRTPDEI